jgi:hypothetical protein
MARYEFIIKNETDGAGGGNSPTAPTSNGAGQSNSKNQKGYGWFGNVSKEAASVIGGTVAAVGIVSSFAFQDIGHRISTVNLRTGQAELQARQEYQMKVAQKGLSILSWAVTGLAVTGGNPVGAIGGALIGMAHTAIGMQQAAEVVQIERSVENVSIELANIRAGSLGDRHSRGAIT